MIPRDRKEPLVSGGITMITSPPNGNNLSKHTGHSVENSMFSLYHWGTSNPHLQPFLVPKVNNMTRCHQCVIVYTPKIRDSAIMLWKNDLAQQRPLGATGIHLGLLINGMELGFHLIRAADDNK